MIRGAAAGLRDFAWLSFGFCSGCFGLSFFLYGVRKWRLTVFKGS